MADLLKYTWFELTDIPEEVDVLLLNTCSIREKAQEKVFHQLGRWKELKKQNPNLVIGMVVWSFTRRWNISVIKHFMWILY